MNLVLKLSKLCNLRCRYCYEFDHLADPARMSLDGLARFLESLGDHQARHAPDVPLQFALHGGEPLLLPAAYLKALAALQHRHLGARGLEFHNAIQTNLYRVPPGSADLLAELDIGIGVSLDVHGGERVTAAGEDAETRVRRNLHTLHESGARVGGISVLHAGNADRAADTFGFWAGLGLDYRILPVFSMTDPPARLLPLMLGPDQIVAALQDVVRAQLNWRGRPIRVYPLDDYLNAAVRHWHRMPIQPYHPVAGEWALIVDTNGDVYNHAEAYDPRHCFGNVFAKPVAEILRSRARQRVLALRARRAQTCERCEFGRSCTRVPVIEALPSERTRDAGGALRCVVAQPMIAWHRALLEQALPRSAARPNRRMISAAAGPGPAPPIVPRHNPRERHARQKSKTLESRSSVQ